MSTHIPSDAGSRDHTFLLGMLAGAAVGGSLALMFAPRQGRDMRQGLAQGARQASRRLSETYGTVADSARRGARQLARTRSACVASWRAPAAGRAWPPTMRRGLKIAPLRPPRCSAPRPPKPPTRRRRPSPRGRAPAAPRREARSSAPDRSLTTSLSEVGVCTGLGAFDGQQAGAPDRRPHRAHARP